MARRRRRRPTDWVVAHWSESQVTIDGTGLFFFDLLSAADLEAHQDRMTCIRIVGSYHFTMGGVLTVTPAPVMTSRMVMLRIFKGDERDEPAGAVPAASVPRYDPFLTSNADDEYMYQREMYVQPTPYAPGDAVFGASNPHFIGEDPYYSNIDCRVMRKLSNEERIILAIRTNVVDSVGSTLDLNVMLFIRALVKLA